MTDYIRITPEGHIRVTSASPFDYIVSYVPFPDINKMVGDPIALPNTATITRKSGKVETLIVNWEPVSTEFAGTFDISGSVGNGACVVVQRVIVAQILTDLDILRQIRDANPDSQLPVFWSEDRNPYTEWDGVAWENSMVINLTVSNVGITTLPNVNKLTALTFLDFSISQLTAIDLSGLTLLQQLNGSINLLTALDLSGLTALQYVYCFGNQLATLVLYGLTELLYIDCSGNQLTAIPSLISKGSITNDANFTHNLMPPTETDRLINVVGFTPAQVLPQDV